MLCSGGFWGIAFQTVGVQATIAFSNIARRHPVTFLILAVLHHIHLVNDKICDTLYISLNQIMHTANTLFPHLEKEKINKK